MAWDPVGPCRRVAGELMGPCHRVAAARWGQGPHVAGHRRDPVAVERLDKRATWATPAAPLRNQEKDADADGHSANSGFPHFLVHANKSKSNARALTPLGTLRSPNGAMAAGAAQHRDAAARDSGSDDIAIRCRDRRWAPELAPHACFGIIPSGVIFRYSMPPWDSGLQIRPHACLLLPPDS